MRKCKACGSKIKPKKGAKYCREDENKTCFDNNGGMERRIAAEKNATNFRQQRENFIKSSKYQETVTNTCVCEAEGCEKTYQITRKKWTGGGKLSKPSEESRFKFCSVKCSRKEATRRKGEKRRTRDERDSPLSRGKGMSSSRELLRIAA